MGRKKMTKATVKGGALATQPQGEYAALQRSPEEIKEIIQTNVGTEGLTLMDLDRIKIPTGGTTVWSLPSLKGEEHHEEIEGVIVAHKTARAYWESSIDETGGGEPPDCSSDDGASGVGEPGGSCLKCPLNVFGTAPAKGKKQQGRGKACKELRVVFMILPNKLIPVLFMLPPTSIGPMRKYFLNLASVGLPSYGVTTKFALESTKNKDGIVYALAKPLLGRELNEDEIERVRAYASAIGPAIRGRTVVRQDEVED